MTKKELYIDIIKCKGYCLHDICQSCSLRENNGCRIFKEYFIDNKNHLISYQDYKLNTIKELYIKEFGEVSLVEELL